MPKRYRGQFDLVNRQTGEVTSVEMERSSETGGQWVKLFQKETRDLLLRHRDLSGESLRVLLYLASSAGWANQLPGPTDTANAMGMRPPQASRAYRHLVHAEFLVKRQRTYYLSPIVFWRGTERALDYAMRQYFEERPPAIGLRAVE